MSPCSLSIAALSLTLIACGARTGLPVRDDTLSEGGGGSPSSQPDDCELVLLPRLSGRVWDQTPASLDFEGPFIGDDRGIVERLLGEDGTPVYAGEADNPSTHGAAEFLVWFHDLAEKNLAADFELPLIEVAPFTVASASGRFFPIDEQLLGNEGRDHNYHFTLKLSASFRYRGGETFAFSGDDDLFVYFNGRLVLDLGGVHAPESGAVATDDVATEAALELEQDFVLDLFFAERHTTGSVFELVLAGFQTCAND